MKHKPVEKHKQTVNKLSLLSLTNAKKIVCTSCNHEVPADNININDKIAKCNHCNSVFSFEKEIASLFENKRGQQELLKPEGVDVFYFDDELDIAVSQPGLADEIASVLLLFLTALIVTAFQIKFEFSLVWPTVLWGLSFFGIYAVSNRSNHKIHISTDEEYLSLAWRPKKFRKDRKFAIKEIAQLYTRKGSTHAAVYMILNGVSGQKHIKLISGLNSASKARYIEQEIEKHLGIEDKEVPEEK